MSARSLPTGTVASALAVLTLAACAGHVAVRAPAAGPPPLTATMDDLFERLNAISALDAWSSEAELRFEDLETHKSHTVKLRLAAHKPADLRLQANKSLLPTLFVLVANRDGVWLDVPTRKRTYFRPAGRPVRSRGAVGKSILAFDPQDFLSGLVPDPPRADEQWALEEEPRAYVLAAAACAGGLGASGLVTTRRLTFERERLDLARLQLYDGEGRLVSDTRFGPRAPSRLLPETTRVERPFERVALELRFEKERREPPPAQAFRFHPGTGRTIDLSLDDADVPSGLTGEHDLASGSESHPGSHPGSREPQPQPSPAGRH